MYSTVNPKSNLTLFAYLGFIRTHNQMARETSGPRPSKQEIRMAAFERKFNELLSFVQLIARWNLDDEDPKKEDNKNTNDEEQNGHSHTNTTPPPPTPPKPEGKNS